MKRKKPPPLPAKLERARARFDSWRRTRTGRVPIPESLWKMAVKLTEHYSVHRVSRALRLNGTDLKRRAVAAAKADRRVRVTRPRFVEVDLPPTTPQAACVVEVENGHGARLKISFRDCGELDLVKLREIFLTGTS